MTNSMTNGMSNRRLALMLWSGLALLHLAFWSGACGYGDLYEYATLVEQLWSHQTWSLPDGQQSRFCWGFPVLLLPFQALGRFLEMVTGHEQLSRWILATLPWLAATAAPVLLLLNPGEASQRSRALAAVLLGVSAGMLYYSRMLHLEPVVGLTMMGAWLVGKRVSWRSAVLAGLLLAVGPSCHFAYLPGAAVLACGIAWGRALSGSMHQAAMVFVAFGALTSVTLVMNHVRYGSWLTDGYSRQESVGWSASEIVPNLPSLGLVAATVPWVVLAFVLVQRKASHWWCLLAVAISILCWLGTWQFRVFPLRYLVAWGMVAALLLPAALDRLAEVRFGLLIQRWLVVWVVVASVFVMAGWQESRPFARDPELPGGPMIRASTWLFSSEPTHQPQGHYRWIETVSGRETIAPYVPLTIEGMAVTVLLVICGAGLILWALSHATPALVAQRGVLPCRANAQLHRP